MSFGRKVLVCVVVLVLYLLSTVPVGLFLYSLKSDHGINVFSKTGFHSYMACLKEQVELVAEE